MLQLFRNNHFLNSLILLPLTVVLHFSIFLSPAKDQLLGNGILGHWTVQFLGNFEFGQDVFVIFLIFIQAILINRLVIIHRMGAEISLIPGYLWIILSAVHPAMMGFHAILLAILFILLGMQNLFNTYKKSRVTSSLFNAGFFFGISSLLFTPLSVFFLFVLIGLNVIRTLRPIEIRQYITAFLTPYLLLACAAFVFDDLWEAIRIQWVDSWGFFNVALPKSGSALVSIFLIVLLVAISFLNANAYSSKKIIYAQKKINVLFVYLFFGAGAIFLSDTPGLVHTLFILWPISYFLSETFLLMKNAALAELFSFLLLGYALFMQYQNFF